jgi:hypothetical protein
MVITAASGRARSPPDSAPLKGARAGGTVHLKPNVLAAVALSLSLARCASTVVIGAPGITLARLVTIIGASWQPEDDRGPLREEPASSEERHRSCACAHERAPSSPRRSHVLEPPGGLLATGESGGTGPLVRRWRHAPLAVLGHSTIVPQAF